MAVVASRRKPDFAALSDPYNVAAGLPSMETMAALSARACTVWLFEDDCQQS